MQPVPNFSRAIFLAAPHKGTDYADRWHTKLARKIIRVPSAFWVHLLTLSKVKLA